MSLSLQRGGTVDLELIIQKHYPLGGSETRFNWVRLDVRRDMVTLVAMVQFEAQVS